MLFGAKGWLVHTKPLNIKSNTGNVRELIENGIYGHQPFHQCQSCGLRRLFIQNHLFLQLKFNYDCVGSVRAALLLSRNLKSLS